MKRKIFTLLLSAFFGTVVMAQTTAVIKKAGVLPVIDGVADPIWANAEAHNIAVNFPDNTVTLGDAGTTTWKALWSDDGIYILLTVNDDVWLPAYISGSTATWTYDKPEIYFDVNAELLDAGGPDKVPGHYQVAPACTADGFDGAMIEDNQGSHAFKVKDDAAYVAEYFVPFTYLKDKDGNETNVAAPIGFDVTLIDKDVEANPYQRVNWVNDNSGGESWGNMDKCGIVTLSNDVVTEGGGGDPVGPGNEIVKVTTAPVIDGVIDDVWAKAGPNNIAVNFPDNTVTLGDLGTTTWKALWNDDGIFILLNINDDVWLPAYVSGSAATWTYDKPEIYFDVNPVLEDAGGPDKVPGHYQVAPACTADGIDGAMIEDNQGSHAFKVKDEASYVAEYFVPFSYLKDKDGNELDVTAPIGFDVTIIDKDVEANPYQRVNWVNDNSGGESWGNMDKCGRITLKSGTGVKRISNANKVYPNPVRSELTVSKIAVSNSKISIYNAVGQKMMEKTANGNLAKFDVSSLRKGMYFVRFSDGTSEKFIKQ